jgi:uncharacterized protein YfeS
MDKASAQELHLEAVEEGQDKIQKLEEAWNRSGDGMDVGQFPKGLLAHRKKPSTINVNNERGAQTDWL